MDRDICCGCLRHFGILLGNMLYAGTIQWCFLFFLCVQTSNGYNTQDICQRVDISGTTFQTRREGTYHILDSTQDCNDYPSYKLEDSENYLFYVEDDHRWTGWLVGSTLCYNLGGIAADSSARDPTQVSSQIYWQEQSNGVWYINRGIQVTCEDGNHLSEWAIAGIVLACLFLLIITVLLIVCCVKKHQKGPIEPITSRSHRRHHHHHMSNRNSSLWSRTAWTTSSSFAPMAQTNFIVSNADTANPPATENTPGVAGPPPSYQESLQHQVYDLERIPEVNNNSTGVTQESTQSDDVSGTSTRGGSERPVFSPPPAYSYSVV